MLHCSQGGVQSESRWPLIAVVPEVFPATSHRRQKESPAQGQWGESTGERPSPEAHLKSMLVIRSPPPSLLAFTWERDGFCNPGKGSDR